MGTPVLRLFYLVVGEVQIPTRMAAPRLLFLFLLLRRLVFLFPFAPWLLLLLLLQIGLLSILLLALALLLALLLALQLACPVAKSPRDEDAAARLREHK